MSAPLAYRGVAVGYGDAAVVTGVELDVGAGRFVGLVGPNGAGKSTLLRAVTGTARVLGGSLELGGRTASALTDKERARLVAVVPQAMPATFAFSALEFVEMGRHAHLPSLGGPGDHDREVARRAMELTDTARLADEPVDTLSGGDLQRLVLAQALTQEPRVLLLDEPVSHLDLNHRLQVLDLVRDLADDGMAVLAVFHDLDLAARYSDEIAVVHDGTLRPAGPPHEVLTAETLSEVFAVRAVVGTDPVTGSVQITPVVRTGAVAPERPERVFVACGAGSGARLMRKLALAGFRVSSGALERGDTDQGVAEALGVRRVDLPPFGHADGEKADAVAALAREADVRVVAGTPFGSGNVGNLRAAVEAGVPLVLVGEMGAERDFSGGEATALWHAALDAGAVRARDDDAAFEAVMELTGGDAS